MLDHIGLEVSDLARSLDFYDPVFFALGGRRIVELPEVVGYGINAAELWIGAMRGPAPAPGYGHLALRASGRAAVDAAHRAGLAHGGRDDGAPGPRPQYGRRYYAGYLRDPDGYRLEIVCGRY